MNKGRRIGRMALCLIVSFVMIMTLIPRLPAGLAYAATGDTPPHTKTLTDNHDGTYTLSLDVVGDSEKKPNNVNVTVILDVSGSMDYRISQWSWTTRMDAAQDAVNSLADKLYAYNTTSNPDTVEMALVTFSNTATIAQQPTNNATTFKNAVNRADPEGGTNWEGALQTAKTVNFGDNDQTFVIFVSDGNPSFRFTEGNYPNHNNDYDRDYYRAYGVWGTGDDTVSTTVSRCYEHAVDDAQALAQQVGVNNFFTIGAFGSVTRMQSLTTAAGAPAENYYSAADTDALNQAIADILAKIEMSGIGNASIEDGTTNQVTTSSGEVAELLEVDTTSFKYYRSGGTYGTNQPWADAPEAEFKNGAVEWDLSEEGVLENGVRYTVTFDCYPSQDTYDIIAKLKNGDITYGDTDVLPAEAWPYIVDNGGGSYSLRTNTNATLSYDDTRDDAGQQTKPYTNPTPVRTDAATMDVTKAWENELDARKVGSIDMTVLMDDEEFHDVTLSDPEWTEEDIFISPGIIKNGKVLTGAEGHDFTFAELGPEQYNWELVAPTVHPMLIDGTLTMLTMVDEAHTAPSGAQTYTINGKTYYSNGSSAASLNAYNYRRSNLNLTKVVTGEDAPKDATFPFTLTVNNGKALTGSADDTNSDYYVWFSIDSDPDPDVFTPVTDAKVSGTGVVQSGNYWYAPSGTAITVQMKAGWNLRFTNLPTDTTYTFAEGTMPTGFAFNKAELTAGEDSTFSGAQTSTGTIENTNTSYQVEYTNDYELTDLEITKVWSDANNQDGKRLTADELKAKLTLSPSVEGKTPAITDNGNNTYTIKYTGLPRFNNGQEVTYTVAESAIDGYTTTGSPAEDHGTITNTHVPEVTDLSVEKVWDDDDNRDALRPTSVSVQLKADGTAKGDPVTLNESNEWAYTWSNLPKNNAGKAIEYTVEEAAVENYTTSYELDEETRTYTITNSYTPEVTSYTFNKSWDDNDNQDGVRPATISAQLYADGTAYGDPVTIDAQGQWSYTWNNLPKNSAGTAITYTAKELNASGTAVEDNGALDDNYKATYSTTATSTTVTNTHSVEKTQYTVTKTWNDANNQDGIRPTSVSVQLLADGTAKGDPVTLDASNSWTYTWKNLDKKSNGTVIDYSVAEITAIEGYTTVGPTEAEDGLSATIENTHETAKSNYTVNKTWVDADDQDGLRPSSIQVQLYADGVAEGDAVTVSKNEDGTWSYTWTDLPVNKAGTAITYTAKELDADGVAVENNGAYNDDYTATYTSTATSTTVTNTHETLKTYYTITKTWDDANDQDGVRPSSVQAQLYADGVAEGDAVTVSKNEDGTWSYTWNDLPVNKAGKAITYTAKELDATGAAVENGGAYNSDYTATYSTTATSTTVTNTHTPAEIKIIVSKIWEDENDQDGVRPSSVTVNLLANGQAAPREAGDATVQLSASNSWQYTWDKLPEYAAGEKITYSLTEDTVTGYSTDISALTETDEEGVYEAEITNTHEVYKTTVTVTKVWEDEDDKDGLRPDSINVQLMADGAASGDPVELSDENDWTYTWEDLDVNKAGKAITYKVDEPEETEGYETEVGKVTGSAEDGFEVEITNTHEVYKTSVVVSKVWDDADDKDGVRPDSVTVRLLADGEEFKTAELNEANKWAYAWVNLDVNKAGKAITYTVEEVEVEDYEATVGKLTGNADDGYKVKITNYHKAKPDAVMIDPPVQKVVKGNPSKDETFTFQMKAITEGAPMPEGAKDGVMTMDITGSGEKEFGEAWIEEPGTYVYEITEVDTKAANYKYDSTVYTLTVDVVEEADGTQSKLVKTETIKGGDGKIVFTNTYEEPPAPPTGDTTVVVPYIVIGISALILLLMLLFRTRKNRA